MSLESIANTEFTLKLAIKLYLLAYVVYSFLVTALGIFALFVGEVTGEVADFILIFFLAFALPLVPLAALKLYEKMI